MPNCCSFNCKNCNEKIELLQDLQFVKNKIAERCGNKIKQKNISIVKIPNCCTFNCEECEGEIKIFNDLERIKNRLNKMSEINKIELLEYEPKEKLEYDPIKPLAKHMTYAEKKQSKKCNLCHGTYSAYTEEKHINSIKHRKAIDRL
jgi:hypothetical protein